MAWCGHLALYRAVILLCFVVWLHGSAIAADKETESSTSELSPTNESSDQPFDLSDEFALLEDENIVESAARHQQEIGMSPSAIFVLTREDIDASGASNILDLLRLVPGLDVKFNTRSMPSISSRITWSDEGARILVLVDGREANFELMGVVPWELQPIHLEDIERIEVIRGPASSLYGANAMAGVINITTRSIPDRTSVWAGLQTGETGYGAAGVRTVARFGDLGLSLEGSGMQVLDPINPESWALRSWKLRTVAEYRWPGSYKLQLDGGMAFLDGGMGNSLGILKSNLWLRTLRLAYSSPVWQAQLYWAQVPLSILTPIPMGFGGITFAEVKPFDADAHMVDGQGQVQLPTFWKPLLLILGAGARLSIIQSDGLLDGETYSDPSSSQYQQPGIFHIEGRGGVFAHGEWTPVSWLVLTAGARFDYNSVSGGFLSPRLALVFRPVESQFLRLSASRAFRKPSFIETYLHGMVQFPKSSPIQGAAQQSFQDFMSRVVGNKELGKEDLDSVEIGYRGEFFNNRLTTSLDLFYYQFFNLAYIQSDVVYTNGFPDITKSNIKFTNKSFMTRHLGFEFCLRYNPHRNLSLLFAWSHRENDNPDPVIPKESAYSPKNYLSLGGRFRLDSGLIGSLYAFSRSSFHDPIPHNSGGLLSPTVPEYKPDQLLLFGMLGWRWLQPNGIEIEAGIKISQPITPFAEPHWRYIEKKGTLDRSGNRLGEEDLVRSVIGYLQGSF